MNYEKELAFLRKTLEKCRIKSEIISPEDSLSKTLDEAFLPILGADEDKNVPIRRLADPFDARSVYKITDRFLLNYTFFRLLGMENVLLIGPYLSKSLSPEEALELGEGLGISQKNQKLLERFYSNVPVLSEKSQLFAVVDSFCDLMWDGASYSVVDIVRENLTPAFSSVKGQEPLEFDEILANMKLMEERYSWENALMHAVSLGQSNKANQLLSMFSEMSFEKRSLDPLRDMKNYCVIMNTLLRKAAEQGGVHPTYLDSVSSSFALKIEQSGSVEEVSALMPDILNAYFRLVRKHSLSGYSPIVQKVILIIDADLSADLTLSSLAAVQNISEGYLATVFKKETGKTISEYVREKRIKHAKHLLTTTRLQVQTVALNCGIMDVQYFSKIFKKMTGKSPKEYRESGK